MLTCLKSTDLALELWKAADKSEENGLLSPISILSAFSMLLAGAKTETAAALKKALHIDPSVTENDYHHAFASYMSSINEVATDSEHGLKVSLANRIFLQNSFQLHGRFLGVLKKCYLADIGKVDFMDPKAAASSINSWVEKKTDQKIKNLVQEASLDKDTKLVLVNAIHFKGEWRKKFKSSRTQNEPFHLLNGSTKDVAMMSVEAHFPALDDSKGLNAISVELPFREERFSLVVLVPKKIHGFQQLCKSMNGSELRRIMKEMKTIRVGLKLPRFRVESTLNLNEVMKKLGAGNIFTGSADFSGITTTEKLCVNKAIHKTFLEVNEKGVEAAASTSIEMTLYCLPPPPELDVNVDRPFLTWIWDKKTETILFLSHVCDPPSIN